MITQILLNSPLWVWPLLAVLLVVGFIQTRNRIVSRPLVMILPVVMLALSLSGIFASFGGSPSAFGAWLIGIAVAAVLNELVFLNPRGVQFRAERRRFEIPGSFIPLLLILAIFCTRFAVGVSTAIAPALSASSSFVLPASASLGFLSGMFLARAVRILQSARNAGIAAS